MDDKHLSNLKLENEIILAKNLNTYTFARVGLPRSGFAISMQQVLSFRADYAAARDAIQIPFEIESIRAGLLPLELDSICVLSQASTKELYLQRPDLGRLIAAQDQEEFEEYADKKFDISIAVTNGLSAQAVNEHAAPLLLELIPKLQSAGYSIAPIVFVTNARVSIADCIGENFNARLSVILVGERPGLSSPDSMGAYLTYSPKRGLTDEKRNCISNIRPKGLPPYQAADKLFYLISESLRKKISGVNLKDEMPGIGQ